MQRRRDIDALTSYLAGDVAGLMDSSGLKFHYTRTLRPHDAGIMELGLEYTDKMALPPRSPLWKLVGYCIPRCTQVVGK